MSKAPNGRGSVRKIEKGKDKGKYRVAVVVGWTTSKSGKKAPVRRGGVFAKRADADAKRDELLRERAVGAHAPAARRTLAEQLALWLREVVTPNRSSNTASSYRSSIDNHIVPHIGGQHVGRLNPRAVEAWLTILRESGAGERTRQMAFVVLSAALSHAVRRGDLGSNPCQRVEKPRCVRSKIDPFTRDELNWILAESFEGPNAALFRMLASTGMRQGEAFGLRPRDVDPISGTVTITRQAVESEGRVIVQGYPKTDSGNRTLALTDAARALIFEHRRRMMKRGFAGREFEFVAPEGGVIRRSTFRMRVWVPMLERLAIRHRGPHHLRHTFATLMLGDRVPLHVVSKILGHAKPSITADLYAHAIPDQIEEAGAAARRLFG